MNNAETNSKCIDVCNKLLRGERSAEETYAKAIEKYSDHAVASSLTQIKQGHNESVRRLSDNVRQMGGTPDNDSGAWGTFANAVQSAANLIGENSAINSLIQGEEHGQNDYEDALNDSDVMEECKAMMRNELMPRIANNLSILRALKD